MKIPHILLISLAPLFLSCDSEPAADASEKAPPAADTSPEQAAGDETPPADSGATPADDPAEAGSTEEPTGPPQVRIETNMGDIVVELDPGKAPITVKNFLGYVDRGHFDGTAFHRVIDGFMIQGGGFAAEGGNLVEKKTGPGIKNEGKNGLKNLRGTIAMARTGDPDSATAQFFINVNDNQGLDYPQPDGHGYAVFGKVVEGMEVVDAVKGVSTTTKPLTMLHPITGQAITQPAPNVPVEPVVIKKAARVTAE